MESENHVRETEGEVSSEDSDGDGVCDYEKLRMDNIRKNHSMLRSLGLLCKPPTQKRKQLPIARRHGRKGRGRGRKKKKKRQCSSSESSTTSADESSEEEWQPWKEEGKKRSSARVSQKMAPLDFQSKQQIFTAANKEIKNKMKALHDGKKPAVSSSSTVTQTSASGVKKKKEQTKKCGLEVGLEVLFQSEDEEDEEEFLGFTLQEAIETGVEVCNVVPNAVTEQWMTLFGKEEDEPQEEFTGFTRNEVLSTEIPVIPHGPSRRHKVRVHYEEEVISDDDEYLFCDDCSQLHRGDCPVHGELEPLPDIDNDQSSLQYTKLPVPSQLTVKPSSIRGAGLGVFATQSIGRRVKFGPYVGRRVPASHVDNDTDTSYMWEIKQDGVKSFFIDGRDESTSNWLRFINCARNEEEQNMVAFQYHGRIYYRTFKTVYPGNELLVWYGEEYAADLGITVEYSGDLANHVCKGCGVSFVEQRSFQIHLKHNRECADANPQVYKCGKCHQRFSNLHQLQTHIQRHEELERNNGRLHFQDKENICNNDMGILPVSRNGTDGKPFKCQYCLKTFNTASHLRTHLRILHPGAKLHKCEYCGKAFSDNSALRTHLRIHTGARPFECDYCGKRFNRADNLRTHCLIHTGERPFECEYCGKRFNQASNLHTHLSIHTGDKPFKCEYCAKAFNRAGTLHTHLRIHTGDRPYKCEYCGKAFSDNSTLHKHRLIHTGDKPFECEYCGKTFNQAGTLHTHLLIHTGEKPFKCEYCTKAFNRADVLHRHLRIHTGEKPFKCEYCSRRFSDNSHLHTHLRIHTADKPFQ